ncbi:hypothetical protein KPL70_026291 [Citrus sinensis]|nr:hypothetical protein KPL70_026291 [Citrus sinensis]
MHYVRSRGRGRGRGHGHGRGWNFNNNNSNYAKGESSTRGRGRGNPRLRYDKSQVQCYNCQKFGHYASEYRAPSTRIEERVNYAEEKNDEDGTLLLARNDTSGDQSWTWRLQYGHLNFGGLELLPKKNMVKGLPYINHPDQLCEGCLLSKQFKKSFLKELNSRAQKPLELIHTDVCGPFKPNSLVFKAFKKFKAAVEKESEYHIKAMRSDRGEEFTSKELLEFCNANGIRRPLTVPRSPQQNSVAERKNRTIIDMARSMLKNESRAKLDDKSEKFIFIGYDNNSKGYKLYNPNNGKIVISRDAVFNKEEELDFGSAALDEKWRITMDKEIKAIVKNDTWELTTIPKGHKAIGVKWVYKTKRNANGEIERHKARLVAKGYSQKAGIDYNEVFAPVARLEIIRLIIFLAAQNKWKIFQMDVKSTFLNGFLEEEIYIEKPLGFVVKRHEDKVLRLKKAFYGLKQAPRAWNSIIDKYFQWKGFTKCPYKHGLYVKEKDGDILIVCLYVDDLIFTGSNPSLFEEFKRLMIKEFEMTNIRLMAYYLGIEVKQKEEGIFISQESYAKEILKKFKMNDYILYAVGLVSRYMENPKTTHFKAAKRIIRDIKGTTNFGLLYSFSNDYKLVGYSDNDWGGDVNDRKSTIGFVFFMGDIAFTWMSKKQPIVMLSTCEAEYVAATSSVCHAIWLRNLLKELGLAQEEPTEICVDNKSAIALSKNSVFHDRSKHIDTRYHFIRECIARKEVQIKYVKSQDQAVDIFTKPLKQEDFVKFISLLGVIGSSLRGGVGS